MSETPGFLSKTRHPNPTNTIRIRTQVVPQRGNYELRNKYRPLDTPVHTYLIQSSVVRTVLLIRHVRKYTHEIDTKESFITAALPLNYSGSIISSEKPPLGCQYPQACYFFRLSALLRHVPRIPPILTHAYRVVVRISFEMVRDIFQDRDF